MLFLKYAATCYEPSLLKQLGSSLTQEPLGFKRGQYTWPPYIVLKF